MPRGRKKLRGGLLGTSGSCRGGSSDSCGAPRVKETRLDCDYSDLQYLDCVPHTLYREDPLAPLDDPLSSLTRVDIFHPCDSVPSPTKSFREKITDFFSYSEDLDSDRARSASPVMPVLVPQVSLTTQTSDIAMAELPVSLPPLSTSSLPPPLSDCEGSEQSCGNSDSGKENDEVDIVMWRGSRSSITSRTSKTSRPRSGHLSDINTTQQGKLPLGQTQQATSQPERVTRSATGKAPLSLKSCEMLQNEFNIAEGGLRGDYPTPSSNPQSPPTPHKIIRLKELSLCNPLQKLKSISLTPKKNLSTKGPKVNKRQAGLSTSQLGPQSGNSSSSTPTLGAQAGTKAAKLAQAANTSHKVTEYFPIRRSERKPKAELLKEQMEGIEARLLANEDTNLGIEVAFIENKGRGIQAVRDFSKGEFVVEYAGDLIDIGTAKDLEAKYSMDTSKGCYMYYFKHKGKQYCIDATGESGRFGRLLNHSRVTPNCMTKVIMLGETPRLILVAKSDIVAGTELLYDYGDRSKESLKAHPWLSL
eukprot:TRINITY_DN7075_c0_g1_i1.p1 TRINITY_DN7075_c0_g1~~TRINITY_DN7075_c0_g1_i1.p1  ORF type:complete len:531 (-),score=189.28 TRINITY_DN7075_c0_g1_i1:932-2524(-)